MPGPCLLEWNLTRSYRQTRASSSGATSAKANGTAVGTCNNWSDGAATTGAVYGVPEVTAEWFNWTNIFGCSAQTIMCLDDTP